MSQSRCLSVPDRECRGGGPGSCRRCPHRHRDDRSLAEKFESLVCSWVHAVSYGATIWDVPQDTGGAFEGLRDAVAARLGLPWPVDYSTNRDYPHHGHVVVDGTTVTELAKHRAELVRP